MLARNRWLTALATLLIVPMIPAALTAQEGGKCDAINDGSPFQLKGAQSYIIFIADPGKKGNETPKHMKSATALLTTEPEKIKNEPGRNFLLLRLYSAWLGTDAPFIANRGTLGYTTDVGGNQNLLMAIDTIATYLEKNVPQCKA
ncbi:MAG: hypothetical protein ABJB66_10925, partial [Gemmatimonadaceae bacterium]